MKYLGIDYGKTKIGLAISEGSYATPFKVIKVSSVQDAVNQILQIVKKEAIDSLVIGLAESGEARKITKNFLQKLMQLDSTLKVIEVDETLSTQFALEKMIELKRSKKQRTEEDAYAASFILQNYLDTINL